jgi:hypothetical protein
MFTYKKYIVLLIAGLSCLSLAAQKSFDKWEYKVFAGYNMGATTPFPLPAEIRKNNSWNPGLTGTLAFHVSRRLTPEWGVTSGLAIDVKGATTDADVKYWRTSVEIGEGENAGFFTGTFSGRNKTKVRGGYVVLPLLAAYYPSDKWVFRLGGYFALLQDAVFEGSVSDGYIRNGGPTGERIDVDFADFDFAENMRKTDAGVMASTDWSFANRLAATGQLSWGLVPVFPSSFEAIPCKMYNIYFTLGLAYKL